MFTFLNVVMDLITRELPIICQDVWISINQEKIPIVIPFPEDLLKWFSMLSLVISIMLLIKKNKLSVGVKQRKKHLLKVDSMIW